MADRPETDMPQGPGYENLWAIAESLYKSDQFMFFMFLMDTYALQGLFTESGAAAEVVS